MGDFFEKLSFDEVINKIKSPVNNPGTKRKGKSYTVLYGYLGRNESWLESAADAVWKRSKKKGNYSYDLIAAIVYAKKSNTSAKEKTEIKHVMKYDSEGMTKNKWQAY